MGQLETGIRDGLLGDAGITDVVGTRIRPVAMSGDDARPYVTYQVTDRKTNSYLDGTVDEYAKVEFELGVFGDSYDTVMELSDLLRDRLDQFGETVSGVEFAPVEFEDESDIEETVPDGQEMPVYLRVQTYKALYRIV